MWFVIIGIALLICVILFAVGFRRNQNINYRTGTGLFKNSEYNLDEKDEFSDKEYYDGDGGLMK